MFDQSEDSFYLKYLDDCTYEHIGNNLGQLISQIKEAGLKQYYTTPLQLYYNKLSEKLYYDFEPLSLLKTQGDHICSISFGHRHIGKVKQLSVIETLERITRAISLRREKHLDKVGGLELLNLLYTTQWTLAQEATACKSAYIALVLVGTRDKYALIPSLSSQAGFVNGVNYTRVSSSTPCQDAARSLIKKLEEGKSGIYVKVR